MSNQILTKFKIKRNHGTKIITEAVKTVIDDEFKEIEVSSTEENTISFSGKFTETIGSLPNIINFVFQLFHSEDNQHFICVFRRTYGDPVSYNKKYNSICEKLFELGQHMILTQYSE